ncbi:glycoside hydrolase family 43 protein [Salipaludibacillus sp. HK11]|uniref:glycoside hydrolase family 43 protein n=1 Tax=Salipaludibacillus sp. HK11 TaxID=3394320 RepID=UPI0039FBB8FC
MINITTYNNPIILGYHPDPSIVRVGEDDYYIITSSFEYFPAVPIFHSNDLVNWKQIGHVLTRESQVNLANRESSRGIFASTIRYHDGVFYMITTDVMGIGNFYVTATKPEGPWSDPIKIPYGNIDPSLMFDDDGTVYVTAQNGEAENSHIIQYEIDITTGKALTEPVVVFQGDGGSWTEGPHLYKIRGMYFILTASGGTGIEHRSIIARSHHPYGPYELYENSILTHNQMPDHPIQNLGHADFVEDKVGNFWAVFLGVRPTDGKYSVLGRETFLAPVSWTEDGWPTIDNNDGTLELTMKTDRLPVGTEQKQISSFRDDFNSPNLEDSWTFLRTNIGNKYSLTEAKERLKLLGNSLTLSDVGPSVFINKSQQHVQMEISTSMEFIPDSNGEEAGLAARYNEEAHYVIGVRQIGGEKYVVAHTTIKGENKELGKVLLDSDFVQLAIRSDKEKYFFLYTNANMEWMSLGEAPASSVSPEINGGFTGVCLGLYATGNGKDSRTPAYFDWVNYEEIVDKD